MKVIHKETKKHYAEKKNDDTDRISSVDEERDTPRTAGKKSVQRYRSMLSRSMGIGDRYSQD